ncbi:hypothetical protein GRF29_106g156928, partial [Pseudopithomyces chartarum]
MSFGFGVGDLITVIKLTEKVRERFVTAPSNYGNIKAEMRNLHGLFRDMEDLLLYHQISDERAETLSGIQDDCQRVLEELAEKLEKYVGMDKKGASALEAMSIAWKRLRWEQKEIDGYQDRLKRSNDAFNHQLNILTSEFQTWLDTPKTTLFCPGIPGAGKTVMSAIMVEKLEELADAGPHLGLGLGYFYCSYRDQQQHHSGIIILANFLRQLVEQCKIPMALREAYEQRDKKGPLTMSGLLDIHCQVAKCKRIEIRANNDDVQVYVSERKSELIRGRLEQDTDLSAPVEKSVIESTNGIFLLARLHMDNLKEQLTRGHLRNALKNLPKDQMGWQRRTTLQSNRIRAQSPSKKILAFKTLQWIVYCVWPLSVPELLDALTIQPGSQELDQDFRPHPDDLDSL